MKNKYRFAFAILVCTTSFMVANAQQSGLELMKKNDAQITSNDEKVDLTMHLVNNKNRKRTRTITRHSITDNKGVQSTLIRFKAPADVKGTGFLEIENSDREDDQWLFLPALNRSRRISANNETDNFMGSDFTYEDIGNEELSEFNYDLIREENINGSDCYKILATPATEERLRQSGYQKREIFLCKETYVITKIDYYDKKGQLTKVLEATDIVPIGDSGKYRAHTMLMKNLKTGHKTNLQFENYTINSGIDAEMFSKRYLENGI